MILLASCARDNVKVQPLPHSTQLRIAQNLNNGRIPAPEEVMTNSVPLADEACESFKRKIPLNWFQEVIQVPENPEQPEGRKINIFYYGKINTSVVPTLFLNGGPAFESHAAYETIKNIDPLLNTEDQVSFVFMDQRGTGCSEAYPQLPASATEEQKIEILNRLTHYGSRGIVADAEQVRQKIIGQQKWNIFGQSYGGHIALRYLTLKPINLKAAFSHAGVVQNDGYERARNRILSQQRVLGIYFENYPADRARLQRLRDYLTPGFCFENSNKSQKICGHEVFAELTFWLGLADNWPRLHTWLGRLVPEAVSLEALKTFVATFYFAEDDGVPNNLYAKRLAATVISWSDRNMPPFSEYICKRIQAETDLTNAYLNECAAYLQKNTALASQDPRSTLILNLPQDLLTVEAVQQSLLENPQLPFYLYSGQLDSYVPVESFQELLGLIADLPNVHYKNFELSGHEGFKSETQLWNDLKLQSAKAATPSPAP